jgi:hypothetical protein
MQLSNGNIAVVGATGLRAEINTIDPSGQALLREGQPSVSERSYRWLAAVLVFAVATALLVLAYRVYKRKVAARASR